MANSKHDYDLIVIGSGPGGYVAAIRASQLGLKTACIERDRLGGVCLNIGCIPSKALIHQAEAFRSIPDLERMGLAVDRGKLDYAKVFQASRQAAETLSRGVEFLFRKNNIATIKASATLAGPNEVRLEGEGLEKKSLTARFLLVATGSRPRSIPGFEIDEKAVLSSTGLLMLEKLPASLLVLGSGYIGMEFAHVMNAFGVQVRVVEMLDAILPLEDRETAAVLERAFRKRGIEMSVSTKAVSMKKVKGGVEVVLEAGGKQETAKAEKLLVAVGRAPNTENLGLEALGVKVDRGFVVVGDYYQTAVPSVYAIGDITPSPMLAHVASKEGEIAVEHMAGHPPRQPRIDPLTIPGGIYTEPQMASFGYGEATARKAGVAYAKAVFPYRGAGKSVAIERSEGLAKVLYDPKTHEILGASVVGAEATELIHELLLARSAELLPEDIATMIHAHPTLSEVNMEVMRAVEGWAIHA